MEKTLDINTPANTFSLVGIILFLIILNWVIIILQDFYSSFRYVLRHLLVFLFRTWKACTVCKHSSDEVLNRKLCIDETVDDEKLLREEVEMVMAKLGILCGADGDKLPERLGSDEIAVLFEEEPSLEEVKEAFKIFDENSDGFIDARELKKVLCTLGFMVVSEVECERMIRAFDDNGDGRIEFNEFVKLVENSFC